MPAVCVCVGAGVTVIGLLGHSRRTRAASGLFIDKPCASQGEVSVLPQVGFSCQFACLKKRRSLWETCDTGASPPHLRRAAPLSCSLGRGCR